MDKRNDIWLKALDTRWVGELRLRVSGRSMYPTLRLGDEVLVESVTATEIRAGDWIVVRTPGGPLLHRFLKFSHTGQLLTKGDALRAPDPPWEPESLLGRVTTIYRDGECMLAATQTFNERVKTLWHRGMAGAWQLLKQGKLLVILWLLLSLPPLLLAAVTLVSFGAQPQESNVKIVWETASEINMIGFYVQRAATEYGSYQRISELVPAIGDIAGAFYEYLDADVVAGSTYYYQLEALETDGSSEIHRLVSVCFDCPETPTPTSTTALTETETPTPTDTPTTENPTEPTATPALYVHFWVDETSLQAGDCTILHWQTDNAASVELDGRGVPGDYREQTLCPCAEETHTLRVFAHDGSYEDHTLTINVSGSCTPVPPDSTSTVTPTPYPTVTPYQLRTVAPHPTQDSRDPTITPHPTLTPSTAPAAEKTLPALTSPTPTDTTGGFPTATQLAKNDPLPTRAPQVTATTASTSTTSPKTSWGGILTALVLGGGLMCLGGWGIWKAWRE